MIPIKTREEIEAMSASNDVVSSTLSLVASVLRPGLTGLALNAAAEECIRDQGAEPGFLNYGGFPATLCISKNDCVVHGIPDTTEFVDGDVVSVDCGALLNGFYGDSAFTFVVGEVSSDIMSLLVATNDSLYVGLKSATAGNRVGDIGYAIQNFAERQHGYGVVRELVGHGIGRNLHEKPNVPNFGRRSSGPRLKNGMVLAVEPMINLGRRQVYQARDGWSIMTKDGSVSAHYEHSVAITDEGPDILSSHTEVTANIKNNANLSEIKIKS